MRKKILGMFVIVFLMAMISGSQTEAAAPEKPTRLKQTDAGITTAEIEWIPHDSSEYIDYDVEISKSPTGGFTPAHCSGDETGSVICSLKAGTTYYVRVKVSTDAGISYSDVLEIVTAPNSRAYKDKIKHTKSTVSSISVSWKAMPGANMYLVRCAKTMKPEDTVREKFVTGTSATLTKLKKNQRYDVEVIPVRKSLKTGYKAMNDGGKIIRNRGVLPKKVTGIKIQPYYKNMTKMSIYYIDSTSADGYEVQLYTSYLKKDKCIKTVRIKNTNQSMLVGHPWLKQNKLFKIRIRGYILNSDKQRKYGEWSEWKCYSHSSARVNKILSYANYGGVKLYWDKISGADQYTVYISTKEGSGYKKYCTTKKTSVDVRKYNGKPLKAGNKMYYVRIVPKCKIGKKWYTPDIHENMGVNNGNGLWFNISKEVKWPAY